MSSILLDDFFNREWVGIASPVGRVDDDDDDDDTLLSRLLHQTIFADRSQGDGVIIDPRSIFRIRIQRNEVDWVEIRFESTTQSTRIYKEWATEVPSALGMAAS